MCKSKQSYNLIEGQFGLYIQNYCVNIYNNEWNVKDMIFYKYSTVQIHKLYYCSNVYDQWKNIKKKII